MLTRQMPVISEFGGVGKVVEDARDLYRLAARDTVRALTEGDNINRSYSAGLLSTLIMRWAGWRSSLRMLQKREQWGGLPKTQTILW